jgi:hypothetical protein
MPIDSTPVEPSLCTLSRGESLELTSDVGPEGVYMTSRKPELPD